MVFRSFLIVVCSRELIFSISFLFLGFILVLVKLFFISRCDSFVFFLVIFDYMLLLFLGILFLE